jgi:mono/diheme cytochrome c family protein
MTAYKTTTSNRMFSAAAYRRLAIAVFAATALATCAVAAGEETFKAKCAGCHGPDGSGNTAMGKKFKLRDLRSADVQKQSDEDLQGVIEKGKPPMPAFGKSLDTAKVQELVAYIRSVATK